MTRAWVVADGVARELPPPEAVDRAVRGETVWLDLQDVDPEEATRLLEPLQIHPLALEDMVSQVNRPKVDDYRTYLYLVLHSARWEKQQKPTLREIDFLIGPRFLITYHDGETRSIAAAHQLIARRPSLLSAGPAPLLHFLLDTMVDLYQPIMDQLSVELDDIEEAVFHARSRTTHVRILRLKRGMAALRRIVGPQRDAILTLTRDEFSTIPAELRPYIRDVFDRMARVSDLLDSFRDEAASLLELYVSIQANRLNEVIKTLTVVATVVLPLTVVTSYYGMNFQFVEYQWNHPWLYALGLMAATVAGTWWVIRRYKWF